MDILLQLHDKFTELLNGGFIIQTSFFQAVNLPLLFANLEVPLLCRQVDVLKSHWDEVQKHTNVIV